MAKLVESNTVESGAVVEKLIHESTSASGIGGFLLFPPQSGLRNAPQLASFSVHYYSFFISPNRNIINEAL